MQLIGIAVHFFYIHHTHLSEDSMKTNKNNVNICNADIMIAKLFFCLRNYNKSRLRKFWQQNKLLWLIACDVIQLNEIKDLHFNDIIIIS